MKARDERIGLMNEVLGSIRMIKVKDMLSLMLWTLIRTVHGLGA
jgi:hypothetical protein